MTIGKNKDLETTRKIFSKLKIRLNLSSKFAKNMLLAPNELITRTSFEKKLEKSFFNINISEIPIPL